MYTSIVVGTGTCTQVYRWFIVHLQCNLQEPFKSLKVSVKSKILRSFYTQYTLYAKEKSIQRKNSLNEFFAIL